jgi:hypothetical protein
MEAKSSQNKKFKQIKMTRKVRDDFGCSKPAQSATAAIDAVDNLVVGFNLQGNYYFFRKVNLLFGKKLHIFLLKIKHEIKLMGKPG